jgi:hypothetical protein
MSRSDGRSWWRGWAISMLCAARLTSFKELLTNIYIKIMSKKTMKSKNRKLALSDIRQKNKELDKWNRILRIVIIIETMTAIIMAII